MNKWRSSLVLVGVLFIGGAMSAEADVSLQFSGHLASGQGTCQKISDRLLSCQIPAGSSAVLELEASVYPPESGVAIDGWDLPSWVSFEPVSGPGTVTTLAAIEPPSLAVGYSVTLVFTATTIYELYVDLEVELLITGAGPPDEEDPDLPYDVPGGEETDQGIEFEIPFIRDVSSFVLGDVTDCVTGTPIDPDDLTTEFSFPFGSQPPHELSDLEMVTVRSPGYVPFEITRFEPFTFSLLFFEITLLMPAEPDLCLEPIGEPTLGTVAPRGACIGDVTTSVRSAQTLFEWAATGPFVSYDILIYDNPCGRYPPPPPTPTPTPTPTTTPGPSPTPTPTPTTGQPVTTTAGVWEPLWDRLTPQQREELGKRGLSGWGWVKAAREILGETDAEIPVEGLIEESEDVLLPDTELLARFGPYSPEVTETVLPLDWILEPGQAFIWQILGVFEDAAGEPGALLSTPECVRYQPTDPETDLPVAPVSCLPPECNIRVEEKVAPAMDGGLAPISETLTIKRDEFVPLYAVGLDFDQLWWYCEPCPRCPEKGSFRMRPLTGKVKFEWEIKEGKGDFVEIGCMTQTKQDVGDRVIFMPPYVEKGTQTTTRILLQIIDDNPSQPIDQTVKRWVTIKTERDDDTGNPDVYKITISSTAYTLPSPVQITPELNDCRAEPPDWKTPCKDLVAQILSPPDDIIAQKEWVRLEAVDLQDPDAVDLICTSIRCIPEMESRSYNDDIRWTWTIVKGGGRFVKGNVGRFVIYEAPLEETEVEIEVSIDNPFAFQCADDVPPPGKLKLRVVKPGIRMELTPSGWLPQGGTAANTVDKRSYLVYKDGGKWVDARPHMCRIHKFELLTTSTEKGFCLNGGPKTDQSLDLWIPEGGSHECSDEHPSAGRAEKFYQKAETKRPVREYTLKVECEDYGAWAFIRSTANAPYESVSWKKADVPSVVETTFAAPLIGVVSVMSPGLKTEYGDNRVTIPFDADENHIADARKHNDRGRAANRDEDVQPAGDGTNGDGLSNYEEFRGFLVKGTHTRTDIWKKDLFVRDQHNLGLGYFPAASQLRCHLIDPAEYDGDNVRIVNFNRGDATRSRCAQHGLHLRNVGIAGLTTLGETWSVAGDWDSPGDILRVDIDRSKHLRIVNVPFGRGIVLPVVLPKGDISATIAHELGHAVSIEHHGEDDTVWISLKRLTENSEMRVQYLPPASKHGLTSGVEDCVMRYNYSDYYWNDPKGTVYTRWPVTVPPQTISLTFEADGRPQNTLCTSDKGTGVNAGGDAGGDATEGDCRGQIHVSDE